MAEPLRPRSAQEVEAAVRAALAAGRTLEIVGQGSKRAVGRAAPCDMTLDLSGLDGITLYEPAELVLAARAGTPLAAIEAAVAAQGQQLAFEPVDLGPLLGAPQGGGTLGGTVAANLSGPRRIKAGAVRDHVLGFAGVSGRGETFKSGGRVVKNVTGYDLSKLMAGSWGTLAAMTDITLKVLPRPETEETLLLCGHDAVDAGQAMRIALGSAGEVSAAAHVPAAAAQRLPVASLAAAGRAVTALRLEGVPPSIAHRRALLQRALQPYGATTTLAAADSQALWRAVRDVTPFAAAAVGGAAPVWRISAAPTRGPEVGALLAASLGAEVIYDWAGGLLWALLPARADADSDTDSEAGAAQVRAIVAAAGGHATLIRAGAAVRAAVDVFDPQSAAVAMLSRRVKDGFDPKGILNPGRMYAGM